MLPAVAPVPRVCVLRPGYARDDGPNSMRADCSCTLVQDGDQRILVDTLGPWQAQLLTQLLREQDVRPQDIDVLICTHGHPDHVGNLNLFTSSRLHIVGFSAYRDDEYTFHPFSGNVPYELTDNVRVIPTPGHTLSCVSVVVQNAEGLGTVVVAGDLFEKEEDLTDDSIWLSAGSEDEVKQRSSRAAVLSIADFIVPGHGPMFQVPRK